MAADQSRLRVERHPAFVAELAALGVSDPSEAAAVNHAQRALSALGRDPGFPRTSAVRSAEGRGLRELRPRAGRSRYRVIFARSGAAIVLLALAPEAQRDPRGFRRALRVAASRLTIGSPDGEA